MSTLLFDIFVTGYIVTSTLLLSMSTLLLDIFFTGYIVTDHIAI